MPANKESTESKENQLLPVSTLLQNTTTSRKLHLATLLFTSLQVNPFQNKDGEPVKLTHLTSWSEGDIPRPTVIFYCGQLGLWKASPWSAEQLTRCHVSVHQALRTVMRNTHEKEAPCASRSSSTAHVPPTSTGLLQTHQELHPKRFLLPASNPERALQEPGILPPALP